MLTILEKLHLKLRSYEVIIKQLKGTEAADKWEQRKQGLMVAIHEHEMHQDRMKAIINQCKVG